MAWLAVDEQGRILRSGVAPDDTVAYRQQQADDFVMILPHDFDTSGHSVDDECWRVVPGPGGPTLVPREQLAGFDRVVIPTDGQTAATMELPPNAEVKIDGVPVHHDGLLEIVALLPRRFRVEVHAWPWQDYEVEIVAR